MQNLNLLKNLTHGDYTNIKRDSLINWMVGIPILLALLTRFFLPRLSEWLLSAFNFDLNQYYILINVAYLLLTPMIFGAIIGFLLLDERDDGTLSALQVTPLSTGGYLRYRLGVPFALSVLLTLIVMPLSGLPLIPWPGLILTTILASLFAPVFTLFLAAFAENKVAGFALMKGANALLILPMAAYFLPAQWQLLTGLIPTYWPLKLYWVLSAGESFWWVFGVGALYQVVLLAFMLKRFYRVVY